jgi:hypothetical protein
MIVMRIPAIVTINFGFVTSQSGNHPESVTIILSCRRYFPAQLGDLPQSSASRR